MIRLYVQEESYTAPVRRGPTLKTTEKALAKARQFRAYAVEVRNDALPRSKSLLAVFRQGVQVCG